MALADGIRCKLRLRRQTLTPSVASHGTVDAEKRWCFRSGPLRLGPMLQQCLLCHLPSNRQVVGRFEPKG